MFSKEALLAAATELEAAIAAGVADRFYLSYFAKNAAGHHYP